jgi:hypothetical protein
MNVYRILSVVGILLAMAGSAMAGPAITTGLMAYYSFDNPANLTADGSGHGYDGTIPTGVTGVTAAPTSKLGGAVSFGNEYNDVGNVPALDYIDLPGAAMNPSGLTSFSFAGYFKITADPVYGWNHNWIALSGQSAQAQAALVGPVTNIQMRTDSKYRLTLKREDGNNTTPYYITNGNQTVPPSTPVDFAQWNHVAVTYNQTGGANALNIFQNGELVFTGPLNNAVDKVGSWTAINQIRPDHPEYGVAHQTSLRLGAATNDQTAGYEGLMDEVYLFNQTLNANQVECLYNVGNYLQGDANKDLTVNVADLTNLLNNYNKSDMTWTNGDANGDGNVNVADLTLLLNNYNKTFGAVAAGSVVPEPSSIAMLAGIALTALLCWWHKRAA